jgi:MFS family permease
MHALFIAARVFLSTFFFIPFVVLYATSIGLDFATLMLVESFFGVLLILLDLPGGHLADRIGPKRALIIGGALQGVACLALFFVPHVLVFWLVQVCFALAVSLSRGADSAMNHTLHERTGRAEGFELSEARFMALLLAARAMAYFASGLMALLGYRYTFLFTGITQLLGCTLLLAVPDGKSSDVRSEITLGARLKAVIKTCTSSLTIGLQIVAIVLVGSAFSIILYLLPALADAAGIATYRLGALFALSTLGAAGLSFLVQRSAQRWLAYGIGMVGFLCLAPPYYVVLLVGATLVEVAQSLIIPRFRASVMQQLGHLGKATAMSVISTAMILGFTIMGPTFGHLTDAYGLDVMLYACWATFAAGAALITYLQILAARRTSTNVSA